jgi:hypothetical protein
VAFPAKGWDVNGAQAGADLDGDNEDKDVCVIVVDDCGVHVTPVCVSFPKTTIKYYC